MCSEACSVGWTLPCAVLIFQLNLNHINQTLAPYTDALSSHLLQFSSPQGTSCCQVDPTMIDSEKTQQSYDMTFGQYLFFWFFWFLLLCGGNPPTAPGECCCHGGSSLCATMFRWAVCVKVTYTWMPAPKRWCQIFPWINQFYYGAVWVSFEFLNSK